MYIVYFSTKHNLSLEKGCIGANLVVCVFMGEWRCVDKNSVFRISSKKKTYYPKVFINICFGKSWWMVRFLYLSSLWMFIVYHAVLRSYFHSFFNYWECKRFVHIFPCVLLFSHILRILEWDWDEWFIENSEGVSYCALDWLVKLKKSCRESGPECRMCPHEWEELVHSTVTGALKKKKKKKKKKKSWSWQPCMQ